MAITIHPTPSPDKIPFLANKRMIQLATVGGVLIVSAVAYFLVVMPQWQRVGPGQELDTAALEATVAGREHELAQLKLLRANYEKVSQDQIKMLAETLPSNKSIPELMDQIEAIVRQSGLDLLKFNVTDVLEVPAAVNAQQLQAGLPAAPTLGRGVRRLSIDLDLAGKNYRVFKQFLDAVQSHTRLLDVENFIFGTDQDLQNVNIKAYYLDPSVRP